MNQQSLCKSLARALMIAFAVVAGTAAPAQDNIVIRGSNTIGEELAPRLVAEYKKDHKDTAFDMEFKGSAYGIGAVMGGYCDIAGSSKPASKEQKEVADLRNVQLKEYVLGSYTVSVVVNATNPVSNLTSSQVQALFTGRIQNWKDVGGADAPVHLIIRDPVSGTYLGFKELAMGYQDYSGQHVQMFTNYLGIADAVAADPNAIGYTGLNPALPKSVRTVSVDGVMPSAETVNGRKYPYARTLYFYTDANRESAGAKDFINFTLGADGQKVLTQMGYAPKP